jgi:beta,beta-carotene 9',10'-dioxygenase
MIKKPTYYITIFILYSVLFHSFALANIEIQQNRIDTQIEYTRIKLESLEGQIPIWLKGNLIRIGPAKFDLGKTQIKHWFDGLAMLYGFEFDSGKCYYTNKFLRSTPYLKLKENGQIDFTWEGFYQNSGSFLHKVKHHLFLDRTKWITNANANIKKYGNDYVALTEVKFPVKINPTTLDTIGNYLYEDKIQNQVETSCPINMDGKYYNIATHFGYNNFYKVVRFNGPCRELICKIPVKRPSYIHSFAMTKNYIILIENPITCNGKALMQDSKPYIKNFKWNKKNIKQNIFVINKASGIYKTFELNDEYFIFSHINAWEEGNIINVDFINYPGNKNIIKDIGKADSLARSTKQLNNRLTRLTLDTSTGVISCAHLFYNLELPTINNAFIGKNYSNIYFVNTSDRQKLTFITKYNYQNGITLSYKMTDLQCASEPIFIRSPNAKQEDDGILVFIVTTYKETNDKAINPDNLESYLIMLNPQTFSVIYKARVPGFIQAHFHGDFFPKE